MSLPEPTERTCRGCPWRKESAPGYLGPHNAQEWIEAAHGEDSIACHLTIEVDNDWTTPRIRQCAGAARYRANVLKRPRDPEVAVGPRDPDVFTTPMDFMAHHTRKEQA